MTPLDWRLAKLYDRLAPAPGVDDVHLDDYVDLGRKTGGVPYQEDEHLGVVCPQCGEHMDRIDGGHWMCYACSLRFTAEEVASLDRGFVPGERW